MQKIFSQKTQQQNPNSLWRDALVSLEETGSDRGKVALAVFEALKANNERKLPLFDHGHAPEGADRAAVEGYIAEFSQAAETLREAFPNLRQEKRGGWFHLDKEG